MYLGQPSYIDFRLYRRLFYWSQISLLETNKKDSAQIQLCPLAQKCQPDHNKKSRKSFSLSWLLNWITVSKPKWWCCATKTQSQTHLLCWHLFPWFWSGWFNIFQLLVYPTVTYKPQIVWYNKICKYFRKCSYVWLKWLITQNCEQVIPDISQIQDKVHKINFSLVHQIFMWG